MTTAFAAQHLVQAIPNLLRRAGAAFARASHSRPPPALRGLSPSSRALLRQILESEMGPLRAKTLPNTAIGLELADVIAIYRDAGGTFELAVNGWAADELRRHPELLAA